MDKTLERLLQKVEDNVKKPNLDIIKRAYDIAKTAHEGQMRKSGEEYIVHPVEAAIILAEYGMDTDTIVAGLLHDVVEDTSVTFEEIERIFSPDVAHLVDGVTKIGKISYVTREEQKAENIRKMIVAMAKDIRVIIIKLADRLHNMRTIQFLNGQKRRDKALETMEIYAPLAHRLGIRAAKDQLEDLALRELDPSAYKEIEEFLKIKKEEREKIVDQIKAMIKKQVLNVKNTAQVDGRAKSVYSVYRKIYMHGYSFDEIYDVYAVRIIVDTETECYNMLGIVHDMFRPLPNRFKDYISTPKPNMYQSLHTTVIDNNGIIFEIQIRTWKMHYTAEYGIAAHWKYKAGVSGRDSMEEKLTWVRKLLEAQNEATDIDDIIGSIKYDLTSEEVYFFTPKGDVKNLPVGSTIIDFAYSIHSEIGDKLIGAKVDGKMVPISYQIKTGEVVSVLTSNSKDRGPSRDWINVVKTSQARNKIRAWFKKERREENIISGKQEFEKELKRNQIRIKEENYNSFIETIYKKHHYNTADEFYAAIGYGGLHLSKIMYGIKDLYTRKYKETIPDLSNAVPIVSSKNKTNSGVIVEDVDDCLIKFSKCCNPLPGDKIVGFITRGYGVSVHREDCKNVSIMQNDRSYDSRWVNVRWSDYVKRDSFKAGVEISAEKTDNLLTNITVLLSNAKVPIHSLHAKENKEGKIIIKLMLGISDLKKLEVVILKLKQLDGICCIGRSHE